MKRRITVEQLQELTDGKQERLLDWWKPDAGDIIINSLGKLDNDVCKYIVIDLGCDNEIRACYVDDDEFITTCFKETHLPLLSIGQMIELLGEKGIYGFNENNGDIRWKDGCLCDTLWNVVKAVL